MTTRIIYIDWGGRIYGPYRSREDAKRDGFDLPAPECEKPPEEKP